MRIAITNHRRGCRAKNIYSGARRKSFRLLGIVTMAVTLAPLSAHGAGIAVSAAPQHHKNLPVGGVYTGTDGFKPILHTTPEGIHEAWTISHHAYTGQTQPRVACVNIDTGVLCNDVHSQATDWPKALNTTEGPLRSGPVGNMATTQVLQTILDGPNSQFVRFPAVTTTPLPGYPHGSVGVGCVDMDLQANCTYRPLAGLTNNPGQSNVNGLTGFDRVKDRLYGTITTGQVLCYDTVIEAPCPGQPFDVGSPPNTDKAGLAPDDFIGSTELVNDKVFLSSNPQFAAKTLHPGHPAVTCFDPATNQACRGFGTKIISNPRVLNTLAVSGSFDTAGNALGACVFSGNQDYPAPITNCWDFDGNPIAPPFELATAFPPAGRYSIVFQPLTIKILNGELRSYFPGYTEDRVHLGYTACYSWTTASACHGFPGPLPNQNTLGGDTHPYGYGYNPLNNCLYGVGHTGYMFSENATTGSFGC